MFTKCFLLTAVSIATTGCANYATQNNAIANPKSYYETLQSYVAVRVIYPPSAMSAGEHGVCRVEAKFFRDGKIIETKMTKSSGFEDLDRECIGVFERIATLPPTPESLAPSYDWFTLDIPITFTLK